MKAQPGILRRGWQAFTRHQEWNIGIVDAPITAFLEPGYVPDITWMPAPPHGRFVADPFVFTHAGTPYVLYEDFDIRREHGHIAALRITPEGRTEHCGPMLSLDTHLAYPFTFEAEDKVYCVPESAGEGEISLYAIDRIPGELTKIRTLIPGIRAIDPTVFQYEGLWWLACTDQNTGSNDTLLLFYADHFTGPWQAHKANPVKQDIASSRPAGRPFEHDGQIYRPTQDCSRTYGGRIAINRITELSPERFAEETVNAIEPDLTGPWTDGTHTLNSAGDITVIDGKRERFLGPAAWAALRRNLLKIFSGRTGSRPKHSVSGAGSGAGTPARPETAT
jgi:hypothetical protein